MSTRVGDAAVGKIGLGTAPFAFGAVDEATAVATVHAAIEAGVTLIDTALAYTRAGVESYAESIVRLALSGRHEDVLVATKGGHWRSGDGFPVDASRATLRSHCEISLRTLGVERIGLYHLHHVDPLVPLDESVAALDELRTEGKIDAIGLSNVSIDQIEIARSVTSIESVQNRLSFDSAGDLPTARHCAGAGIAYLAYMPLGGPDLARSTVADARAAVAARHGVSVQQVSLAWLLGLDTGIVPLVGSSRPRTIVDSAASARLELDADDRELLGLSPRAAG
ncbi:aldo/keto reductase [Lacisediminihabitans sp.]|uniref:aldo/keto reductase n=1 Tax=Lacisediminihabitans sp. TaxID=2787631 RepID=UPI00374D7DE4